MDPLPSHSEGDAWRFLGEGGPTVRALAELAARQWIAERLPVDQIAPRLSLEAKTLLSLAGPRGTLELKATNVEFDSAERMLTVHVERSAHEQIRFRRAGDVRLAIRFLEAFRELCEFGLVVHQLNHEFALSRRGFELAACIDHDEVAAVVELGEVVGWSG